MEIYVAFLTAAFARFISSFDIAPKCLPLCSEGKVSALLTDEV